MANSHEVTFFQPGQIVFHVAGEANIDSLIDWANSNAPQGASVSDPGSLKFPGSSGQSPGISKAASRLKNSSQSRPYFPPVDEKQGPFTLVSAKVTGLDEPSELLKFILDLDTKKNASGNTLQVVSPNWVMSGGISDPGGTGGPGGRPVKYDGRADTLDHCFHFDSSTTDIGAELENGNKGDGVVVAVLDTAPFLKDDTIPRDKILDEIYKHWVTDATEKHTLLKSLLDDYLQVDYDPEVDKRLDDVGPEPPEYLQTDDHDYLMSDHGLFVSGIIHSLASKAKIYLFQVLNRYGVGDLMSIARGLDKVIALNPSGNMLVNMSLTMQFPLEQAHITTDDLMARELGRMILNQKRPWYVELICMLINLLCRIIFAIFHIRLPGCEASWFERQALPLLSICRSVSILGPDIIAAAGNKRRNLNMRPQAEYPAAFPDVLGVGALPKSQTPPPNPNTRLATASYSNYSDWPPGSGIATLGGEKDVDEEIDTDTGILGIYVGDFPGSSDGANPPTPSANGWARWCGTSFATAVMTGLTANMLSNRPDKSLQAVIDELRDAQPYLTEQNEEVLFVTQGPPRP